MKRSLAAFLVLAVALPHLASAASTKKKSKAAEEIRVDKVVGEERVSPPKERKQADGDGPPAQKRSGPVDVGPPVEYHLNKASGKKFDLRSLPFVPPNKRERPEREGPVPNPVGTQ
ncbi:MAG TPA: hypothetical protein VG323_22530, partial [Thermoanaerobaculia bacterium]|nr:hypothetical protein [Thermoanaerobaculia bacterium]